MTNDDDDKARGVLVWDAPVRVFHWLMVLSFAGAWLTAESERWRVVHVTLGCTMAALVAWRLVWGFVGTRHARFAGFVRGPRAAAQYLKALLAGRAERHAGHNPAGGLAILALLLGVALTTATGLMIYNDIGGDALGEAHEAIATLLLGLVGLHLAGVLVGSLVHRENLVRAMFTGRKQAAPGQGIARPKRLLAGLLVVLTLGFWTWQWMAAPLDGGTQRQAQHDEDDD